MKSVIYKKLEYLQLWKNCQRGWDWETEILPISKGIQEYGFAVAAFYYILTFGTQNVPFPDAYVWRRESGNPYCRTFGLFSKGVLVAFIIATTNKNTVVKIGVVIKRITNIQWKQSVCQALCVYSEWTLEVSVFFIPIFIGENHYLVGLGKWSWK